MYLVFTRMPCESYRRRLRSLVLYLRYVFRALSNSLVCWFCMHLGNHLRGWGCMLRALRRCGGGGGDGGVMRRGRRGEVESHVLAIPKLASCSHSTFFARCFSNTKSQNHITSPSLILQLTRGVKKIMSTLLPSVVCSFLTVVCSCHVVRSETEEARFSFLI